MVMIIDLLLPIASGIFVFLGALLAMIGCFANKRNMLPVIGLWLIVIAELLTLVSNINLGYCDMYIYHWRSDDEYKFNLLCMLPYLAAPAAWIAMALKMGKAFSGKLESARKNWFLPALIYVSSIPLAIIVWLLTSVLGIWGGYWQGFWNIISVGGIAGVIFGFIVFYVLCLWVCWPEGRTRTESVKGDGYCGMVKHILLSLITLGIWQLVWISRATRYLNQAENQPKLASGGQVAACLFLPFYNVYWTYKNAQKLDAMSREYGFEFKLTAPCLALQVISIFSTLLPSVLIQDRINHIAMIKGGVLKAPEQTARYTETPAESAAYAEPAAKTYTATAAPLGEFDEPPLPDILDEDDLDELPEL